VEWLTTAGYVYLDRSDYKTAVQSYQKALALAQQINAKEYIRNALLSLAIVSAQQHKLEDASRYGNEAIAAAKADGNRLDELYPLLVKGQVAEQLHDSAKATAIFREVARDPQSDPSLKWEAEHSLARLDEDIGQRDSASREYEAALCTFETARSELRHEESKLPFFTNASRIYDDYIRFLVASGKSDRALQVADFSRARTLAEGLGLLKKGSECAPPLVNPQAVRAKVGASVLYYWLGEKQSYLWAITTRGVQLFPLPPAAEIDAAVHRYRKAVEDGEDVLATSNPDGTSLYKTLIEPAAPLLAKGARVVIIPDGSLNSLNFETLLVPGSTAPHYWIEDAILTNAHSLRLLSLAKASSAARTSKALLIGDPLAHNPEYPALPNAKLEMQDIEKHFAPADLTVYMQSSATAAAFLDSKPEQYSYIHFVAHAVASSQVPLDSAVILSPQERKDPFKLYARDIIQHSLRARLVTVSACYGAGTRSYNGEGLIGLSWAFLRAGARNTIGALWEVNDASTPQLMDYFYAELQKGRSPDVALRTAKLSLMQSSKILKKPFYWAPFQLYGTS
jgi:CHAT domain-containing protein